MIKICLTKFTNDPWSTVIMKGFIRALKELDTFCTVEEIFGYPTKYYDLIILVGIRSIVKRNLNKSKITNFCKKIIDMGDDSMDPRRNCEDIYFYFNPSLRKLYEHYQYLPKFILEEHLYPEHRNDGNLNIYIDHFKYQNISEEEQSIYAIEKILDKLSEKYYFCDFTTHNMIKLKDMVLNLEDHFKKENTIDLFLLKKLALLLEKIVTTFPTPPTIL